MAVVAAIQLGAAIAAAPVRACSCAAIDGVMRWPLWDAIDVPIDTPIVAELQNALGDPSSVPVRLEDAGGAVIELIETRRIEQQSEPSCWAHETVFFRPAYDLAAGAEYRLFVGNGEGRAFTTGSRRYEPTEHAEPSIRYMHVGAPGSCAEMAEGCELAMLGITLDEPVADGVWLVMRSAAADDHENIWLFRSAQGSNEKLATVLSVALPTGDPCLELGLYGVDGSIILERKLCTPDSCVRYGVRTNSSCDDPESAALDIARVPLGHCDAPLEIEDGPRGPIYPEPEPADASAVSDAAMPPADRGDADAEPASDSGAPLASDDGGDPTAMADRQRVGESYGCSAAPRPRGQAPWHACLWIALGLAARIAAWSRPRARSSPGRSP